MLKLIKEHRWFYALWLAFVVLGSIYFQYFSKADFNLYFNCNKNVCYDLIFKNATHLSEFLVSMIIVLFLLSYRISYGIFYLLNAFFISLIVYVLKVQVFNSPRPLLYFKPYSILEPVAGVKLLEHYSFPSGHSTFAFGSMLVLAIAINNKWISITCFILALSTAISRIYLLQHFYEDIYAGAILGVIITTLHYSLAKKWLIDTKQPWLQFSFIDSFLSKKTK
jgi:membrane-associated phospholipid phosphatase